MANYKGYFSSYECKQYEVKITASGDSSDYKEFKLAGDQPFVVRYNNSQTPFDPVRTSTATINVVSDSYFEDLSNPCAQGTKVELINITNSASPITEWVGYLTPKVFDAGYADCYETFELEAADCISSLQYKDYVEMNSGSSVNIKDVLAQICDATGELEGWYWTRSKKYNGPSGAVILPEHLSIAEHNFQVNDTEEEWKLSEVLEEICKYLGFTCLQWRKRMYFIDYQYLETHTDLYASWYSKVSGYNKGTDSHLDPTFNVTADSYRADTAQISIEPIYNKVAVKANMYAVEDIVPNIFDDKFLTNRLDKDDFYANFEVMPISPDTPKYPHGGTWYSLGFEQNYVEEKDSNKKDLKDSKYRYFHRVYDHKYYDSVYYQPNGTPANPTDAEKASSDITRNYMGGTIVDLGVVRKEYKDEYQNWTVPSKLDYTRYLCICEKYQNPANGNQNRPAAAGKTVFKLKSGYKPMVMVDDKSYLVLNCSCLFERYINRNYINPEWNNTECKTRWTAAGSWRNMVGRPLFKIHVGNKGWSSSMNRWVDAGSAYDFCAPDMRWESDKIDFWNKEISINNNVSWEDKLNCEGIKLPLGDVDITKGVELEILNPYASFYGNTGNPKFEWKFYEYNAYCWIKDLSLRVVQEGQEDGGNDSDVVYENVIDDCSVSDMTDITVKITTHSYEVKPSYSDMIYSNTANPVFLMAVYEESLHDNKAQKPEENIIQKYVHQYSTRTKKITLPLSCDISPLQRLTGVDVDNPSIGYVQLGTEMDYRTGTQTITSVEKDK